MWNTCNVALIHGVVSEDWKRAMIVSLYKIKGGKSEYKNHKGTGLLNVVKKVYSKLVITGVRQIIKYLVNNE